MKCTKCGFESELDHPVCPQCQAEIRPNPAAQKILRALRDPLFLVICILMSISCAVSLAADALPLISILITVFLWLTYAQSRKEIADAKHLRCISGAVYANYVITYVVAGLIVIVGIIFTVAFGLIAGNPDFLETFFSELIDVDFAAYSQALTLIPSGIILVVFVFIAAILVVINIFALRYIHRFAQSVYQSIEAGVLSLKHVTTTKVWMFIIGGLSAVSCLSNLANDAFEAFLSSASSGAICILAGLLIHKYFSDEAPAPVTTQGDNV